MLNRVCAKIIAIGAIILLGSAVSALALEDGFLTAEKISGKYFAIHYKSGVDIQALANQLNIGPSERLLAGKPAKTKFSPAAELAEMLDTLFIRVCDILDMRLYNKFSGTIKICKSDQDLQRTYFYLLSDELRSNFPFYIYSLKTIYVSAENFTIQALGHEIAHAVISHYFVILPSAKVQEVLAGYVEYQLRKDSP